MSLSPLAPPQFPALAPVPGVSASAYEAGLRYQNRADLMLARLVEGTTVAGTFTQSRCPSAPVDWNRSILGRGTARAVVCNAGNANAFTGHKGKVDAEATAQLVAEILQCDPAEVYLASTGVIGETLDWSVLQQALPLLVAHPESGWEDTAGAIMTTDTYPKGAMGAVDGSDAVVVGIAKGSGMIAPDMATMLSFVFTDLAVSSDALQQALSQSVDQSYNRITVDSDTSTSDTVLLFATGLTPYGGKTITGPESPGWDQFTSALDQVNLNLAHQIVRDGEGVTKFVEVEVTGADNDHAAANIARSIADSPLVKTSLGAADPNWGRIVMAVGKAGERAERDRLTIYIGDQLVAENGWQAETYVEALASQIMQRPEFKISVDVGIGNGAATIWTCDLSHRYIDINADYRS